MIIIGIDPGLATVGFGVLRTENNITSPLSYGCIRTSMEKKTPERLLEIYTEISELLEKYAPSCIAVEKLYFARNVTSAISVAEARGVIFLAAEQRQIPVFEYTPNQIKQAITGVAEGVIAAYNVYQYVTNELPICG